MSNHVLNLENKSLQSLLAKVQRLKHYKSLLERYLDPSLAKHTEVVRFEQNCLIVMVDSPTWATPFRFQIPLLMKELKKHSEFLLLSGIICKTYPTVSESLNKNPKRPLPLLSTETAKNLMDIAKTLKDKRLQESLKKIARYSI